MVVQLVLTIQLFIFTVNCFVETIAYISSSIHTWQLDLFLPLVQPSAFGLPEA